MYRSISFCENKNVDLLITLIEEARPVFRGTRRLVARTRDRDKTKKARREACTGVDEQQVISIITTTRRKIFVRFVESLCWTRSRTVFFTFRKFLRRSRRTRWHETFNWLNARFIALTPGYRLSRRGRPRVKPTKQEVVFEKRTKKKKLPNAFSRFRRSVDAKKTCTTYFLRKTIDNLRRSVQHDEYIDFPVLLIIITGN